MLTRQPVCETDIVPSLHSNLDVGSAACGGFAEVADCCGAGACATGFGDKAQPAHESRIDKANPVRIRVASGKLLQQPIGSRANRQLHAFRLQRRGMIRISRALAFHGSLMGPSCSTDGNKAGRDGLRLPACSSIRLTRTASLSSRMKGIERYRRSAGGVPAFGKRNKAPGDLVVVGGA
jgi:hypothetical protein